MLQKFEKKASIIFDNLKKDKRILIKKISNNFKDLEEGTIIKYVDRTYKLYDVHIPQDYHPYMLSIDTLRLNWNINFGEYIETGGEIDIDDLTGLFVNPLNTFDKKNVPQRDAKLLEQGFRFFDFKSASGDMAAVKVIKKEIEPTVYWIPVAEQPVKMSLSYPEYMEHALNTRGLYYWQYLFTDLSFNDVGFNLEEELTERLPYLTMLFPDEDFSEYFEKFEKMKSR
jgi:hypothetical protein